MMNSLFSASAACAGHGDVSKETRSHGVGVRGMPVGGWMGSYMDDFKCLQVSDVLRPDTLLRNLKIHLRSWLRGFSVFSLAVFRYLNLHFSGRSTDWPLGHGRSRVKTVHLLEDPPAAAGRPCSCLLTGAALAHGASAAFSFRVCLSSSVTQSNKTWVALKRSYPPSGNRV